MPAEIAHTAFMPGRTREHGGCRGLRVARTCLILWLVRGGGETRASAASPPNSGITGASRSDSPRVDVVIRPVGARPDHRQARPLPRRAADRCPASA
jgi:hypothetical protein